jgi:hypothetical protein
MAFLRKAQAQRALPTPESFIFNTANQSSVPEALYRAGCSSLLSEPKKCRRLRSALAAVTVQFYRKYLGTKSRRLNRSGVTFKKNKYAIIKKNGRNV